MSNGFAVHIVFVDRKKIIVDLLYILLNGKPLEDPFFK